MNSQAMNRPLTKFHPKKAFFYYFTLIWALTQLVTQRKMFQSWIYEINKTRKSVNFFFP